MTGGVLRENKFKMSVSKSTTFIHESVFLNAARGCRVFPLVLEDKPDTPNPK